jgi:hypothetical protein
MEGDRWAALTTNQKGAIAESAITAHAVRYGIDVYRPAVEGGRCDLVFGLGARLLRVQCKWAVRHGQVVSVVVHTSRRAPGGGHIRTPYTEHDIDGIAAYCAELDRCYLLPISLVSGKKQIYLRLAPARNNQMRKLNFAELYELPGAIAQLGERLRGTQEAAGSSPASSTDRMRLSRPA